MKRWIVLFAAAALAGSAGYLLGYARGSADVAPEERAAMEESFAESMSGAILEGLFAADGSPEPPRAERYAIERVEKLAGDLWLFQARVRFGETDRTLPVPVRVLWAGDTPVISLTDAALPGLGTFTVRLLLFRDRYVGFWSNPTTGGVQYGTITR